MLIVILHHSTVDAKHLLASIACSRTKVGCKARRGYECLTRHRPQDELEKKAKVLTAVHGNPEHPYYQLFLAAIHQQCRRYIAVH